MCICVCVWGVSGFAATNLPPFNHIISNIIPKLVAATWFNVAYCTQNVLYAAFDSHVQSGAYTQGYRVEQPGTPLLYPRILDVEPTFPAQLQRATEEALKPYLPAQA